MPKFELTWDEAKRAWTIAERGLDFADADQVFASPHLELVDDRFDYGEVRYQVLGELKGQLISLVWTPRGDKRRIISMRYAREKENRKFKRILG